MLNVLATLDFDIKTIQAFLALVTPLVVSYLAKQSWPSWAKFASCAGFALVNTVVGLAVQNKLSVADFAATMATLILVAQGSFASIKALFPGLFPFLEALGPVKDKVLDDALLLEKINSDPSFSPELNPDVKPFDPSKL